MAMIRNETNPSGGKFSAIRVSSRTVDAHFWKKYKEYLIILWENMPAFSTASFQWLAKSLPGGKVLAQTRVPWIVNPAVWVPSGHATSIRLNFHHPTGDSLCSPRKVPWIVIGNKASFPSRNTVNPYLAGDSQLNPPQERYLPSHVAKQ